MIFLIDRAHPQTDHKSLKKTETGFFPKNPVSSFAMNHYAKTRAWAISLSPIART